MDNLPEGAVQVTKADSPPKQQPNQEDKDFQGLDIDTAGMRDMILGTSSDPVVTTPPDEEPVVTPPVTPPVTTPVDEKTTPVDDQGIPEELLDTTTDTTTKTTTETTTDPTDLTDEEKALLGSMEAKQKDAFIAMRQELTQYKRTATASDEMKKELEKAQDKLGMYNITEDKRFKAKYVAPFEAKKQELLTMTKEFGGNEELIERVLKQPMRQRVATLKDELPEGESTITGIIRELIGLNGEMVKAVNQHEETKKQLAREAELRGGKEMDDSMNTAREMLMNSNHFLLKEAENSPEWNAKVQARLTEAKAIAATLDQPAARAEILLKARMADEYRDLYLTTSAKLRQIVGHNKNVAARKPGIGTTTTPSPASGGKSERPKGGMTGEDVGALLEKRDYSQLTTKTS